MTGSIGRHRAGTKMAARWAGLLLALFTLFSWLVPPSLAEPVQYCRYGDPLRPNQDIDFCLGLTMHRNTSTGAHNMYLTFTHTRRHFSATGWTAVGVGDMMQGSLMFIVYGDPASGKEPVVSIRTAPGHDQPTLLVHGQMGGADLRVLHAGWTTQPAEHGTATATVSLVCYSCTLWPGTQLSATTTSQPWIWAWNQGQQFSVFSYDAHLLMHKHHAGNGGWGRFYVDMARSESTAPQLPSLPVIRPGVAALGASDSPGLFSSNGGVVSWITHNPLLHLHGMLMALAFLLLFPAGVFAMRSGSAKSFKYHWVLQAIASATVAGGMATGLTLQKKIDTVHQVVGLSISGALALQAYLGWRHHVIFIRIWRRTWISHAHIWLGRFIMVGGYTNIVLGLLLRGYSRVCVGLVVVFMVLESLALTVCVWRQQRKAARARVKRFGAAMATEGEHWSDNQSYFAVASEEDVEEEAGSDEKKQEETEKEALVQSPR